MSSKTLLTLAVVAVVLGISAANSAGFSNNQDTKTHDKTALHPTYSCVNKEDGDYEHPDKCDYFISCVAQVLAYEMPCADNTDGSRLHFVRGSGPSPQTSRCDYPAVAGCEGPVEPEEPTQAPTEKPTDAPTQKPTEKPTEAPTQKPTEKPTEAPTQKPTEKPTAAPTQKPTEKPTEPPTVSPPRECRELDCHQSGDCQGYEVCKDGALTPKACEEDLFWNPDVNNGYGGECTFFEQLSEAVQHQYKRDENCIEPCEWLEHENKCEGYYYYREPFNNRTLSGRVHELRCATSPDGAEQLVFNLSTLNCSRRNLSAC